MNIFHSIRLVASLSVAVGIALSAAADEQRQRASQSANPSSVSAARLDLNTADVKALEAVPVIGADGARAIVASRPFRTIDDLDRVKGISSERLEQIRAVVAVAPPHVPTKLGEPTVAAPPAAKRGGRATGKIDLNTADLATIASIPSIGAETARAIVAARPFTTVDELSRVQGISAERLEQIRAEVTVNAPQNASRKIAAP
jgi:DNA uptake protein ComE-like DNA-binding protein